MGQQVGFGNKKKLGVIKGGGIFCRFIRTLRYRHQDHPFMLAKVKGCRTDQVANVFNKKDIEFFNPAILD